MWQEHNEGMCTRAMRYFPSSTDTVKGHWARIRGNREKERSVDKRDLFKQVGLVSWTVRSPPWLRRPLHPLATMNGRKMQRKREEERVWFVFTAGRPFVWRWKGKARGEKSSQVDVLPFAVSFPRHVGIPTRNPCLSQASCPELLHIIEFI